MWFALTHCAHRVGEQFRNEVATVYEHMLLEYSQQQSVADTTRSVSLSGPNAVDHRKSYRAFLGALWPTLKQQVSVSTVCLHADWHDHDCSFLLPVPVKIRTM